MAENLAIPGRMSVRSPMQWSDEMNGGFSIAPPEQLRRPVVTGKRWGPATINVAAQRRDDGSLLNWIERLIRRRHETAEIAYGKWSIVPVKQARVVLVIHNLSSKPVGASFNVEPAAGWQGLIDLFGRGDFSLAKDGAVSVELEAYGCRWFRVRRVGDAILL
jgi:hypothetical protein